MATSFQLVRTRRVKMGSLFAIASVGGCVAIATNVSTRWIQGVAACSGLSTIAAVSVLGRKPSSQHENIPHQRDRSEASEPSSYLSRWVKVDQQGRENVFHGRAKAILTGDRMVIRQEEDAGGTYVLDLKCLNNNVSGVWWYYGASPPHGMFRGAISDENGAIDATWQGPGGKGGGTWQLTPKPSEDVEE